MVIMQILTAALGLFLLIRGLIESRTPDGRVMETPVYILLYAVSTILLFGGILLPLICEGFRQSVFFRVPSLLLAAALLFALVTVAFIAAVPCFAPKADGNEKLLLVLGAPVAENQPSCILRSRSTLAAEWVRARPNMPVAISGGKGGPKTEAETIAELMAEKGIVTDRMYLEKASTTTEENFSCIKTILGDALDLKTEPIAVLTNRFHMLRLSYFTKRQGYGNVHFVLADTPPEVRLLWYTREVILIIRYWFTGLS